MCLVIYVCIGTDLFIVASEVRAQNPSLEFMKNRNA